MPAIRHRSQSPYAKPLTHRRPMPASDPSDPLKATRPRTAYRAQRAAILTTLASGRALSATELVEHTGLPGLTKAALPDLVAEGLIERQSTGRWARYRITEHGRAVSTTEET